ncbi:Uncharacterized protein T4B_3788 [Trichinella pseudospiralis]|uniref:Integrase zinc-binding domain-containing protein n=1 Tax=Trichinella pseudospiralis TaxID=6337 RepID=A0A0V1K5X3_TRIPS|nr:Uncharacterized protein T4A_9811 [Trichinella pseudospiralis]KRZ24512.1 Uncharacterized protein T4B_3788 [Trichinella pseudospiralis]KRZ42518.1 Uncharacterized protein T4C_7025 [Trichinella pseudospiralis]
MKSAARFYAWWPGLDRDIEFLVERCFTCLRRCQLPLKVSLILWNAPSESWSRLHIDLTGSFKGSNWRQRSLSTSIRNGSTLPLCKASERTKRCRRLFTCFSLPGYIVSDNGPQLSLI